MCFSMEQNYIDIHNLSVSSELKEYCLSQTDYYQGFSRYGTLWSVWECNLVSTNVFDELRSIFNPLPDNLLLSKTHKEGLPRHFDINKWSVLNIPISGNFVESPIVFINDNDDIVDSSNYSNGNRPILFNARNLHAVLPSLNVRLVLSVCWKIEYEKILGKYLSNQLISNFSGHYFSSTKLQT